MAQAHTNLKFIGGVNKDRIGGNCSVIEHTDEKGETSRVMFDLGSIFTPQESGFIAAYPNVDEYFDRIDPTDGKHLKAAKPVSMLFLTHAHEDHIGALINYTKMGYVLPPMKAGGFTRNFVRLAFAKEGLKIPEIEKVKAGDVVKIGNNMEIEAVDVSHSVVDSLGFYTLTYAEGKPYAAIMNNGDFLTEEEMPVGKSFSREQYLDVFKRKAAPTTAVCLDSTSTTPVAKERIGFAKAVDNTYNEVMENADRNLIVSPVISRSVQNIAIDIETARRLKTKVFFDGMWLQTVKDAMLLSGYNNFEDVVYKGTIQSYLNDKQITRKYVICSGAFAQGLEDYQNNVGYTATSPIAMSSAVKMAFDLHPYVKLGKNTLVLARQRIINEINGESGPKMLQMMARQGAKVVMSPGERSVGGFKEVQMQDSGHVNAKAMKELMAEVKAAVPNIIAIPIHGNPEQCEYTKDIMDKIGVATHLTANLESLNIGGGQVTNAEESHRPVSWYAFKTVYPNPYIDREVPLDGLTEYWEIDENYQPLQKICEIQNTPRHSSPSRGSYNNCRKQIEQAENMPYREKMRRTDKGNNKMSKKVKNMKENLRYNLNKKKGRFGR